MGTYLPTGKTMVYYGRTPIQGVDARKVADSPPPVGISPCTDNIMCKTDILITGTTSTWLPYQSMFSEKCFKNKKNDHLLRSLLSECNNVRFSACRTYRFFDIAFVLEMYQKKKKKKIRRKSCNLFKYYIRLH